MRRKHTNTNSIALLFCRKSIIMSRVASKASRKSSGYTTTKIAKCQFQYLRQSLKTITHKSRLGINDLNSYELSQF